MSDMINSNQAVLFCYRFLTIANEMHSGISSVKVKEGEHEVLKVAEEFVDSFQRDMLQEGELIVKGGVTGFYIVPEDFPDGHKLEVEYHYIHQDESIAAVLVVNYDPETMSTAEKIAEQLVAEVAELDLELAVINKIRDAD